MYTASDNRYKSMKYIHCGKSGLCLPQVSLGLWHNFGDTASFANMRELCFTALMVSLILIWLTITDRSRAVRKRISAEFCKRI